MIVFWGKSFAEKQAMWGFEPSSTAIIVADYFAENNLKDILIPGIGYGMYGTDSLLDDPDLLLRTVTTLSEERIKQKKFICVK